MSRHSLAVFLAGIIPLMSWAVEAVYHMPSMEKFSPPPDVMSGSLFSYSIAYQPNIKKLITSAPKLGTGSIYECNIDTKKCDKIKVNGTEDYKYGNMWLGATVATGQNFSMACAPRYTQWKYAKLGTFSRCYATSSEPIMYELPTVTPDVVFDLFEKNMDSFGWTINVDRNDSVMVGGPAMNKGRVMMYDKLDEDPTLLFNTYNKTLNNTFTNIVKFNLGYSVTSGNFFSSNVDDLLYAISSPYGQIGFGMVILTDLSKSWYLSGPVSYQPAVGSLFGAAMAAASLRGPGQRQALLVGAPRYAERGRVDVGVVYIYQFNPALNAIVHQKTILGKKDEGQFGCAIISLGDLNGDKKDEIAVSAPYEDSGRGAVYIYSGGHLLSDVADSMLQSMQRIQPENYRAFGLSLAALQDYDNNGCNELAIGAPQSDKFVMLRCMAEIIVRVQNLQKQIRQNDTHFVFQSCMDFVFPDKPKTVKADILLKISITHESAKLVNSKKNDEFVEHKVLVRDNKPRRCVDVGIIIPKVVGYKPSIQYQITATQTDGPATKTKFDSSHVLLSDLSVLNVSGKVWVADCAGAGECKPQFNLSIQSTIQDGYIIGSSDTEFVEFTVENSGDVAYNPFAEVIIKGVRAGKWPTSCRLFQQSLYCVPRQPVEKNSLWKSEQIELDMKSLKSDVKSITVIIQIYPHGEPKEKYIRSTRTFNLRPDYKGLIFKGSSNGTIELTKEELMEAGKHTSHVYTVYNNGMTAWVNLRCRLVMPLKYFYKDISITVESQAPYQCEAVTTIDGLYTTTCVITGLRKDHKFDVIIPIYIEPGTISADDLDNDKKLTISSRLILMYKQEERSIVSTLKLAEAVVPIWIVIIAALVGLLIIVIIAFALHECGFLRRKNRDKLKQLRKSVHRQSVRRSVALRESMRSSSAAERRSGEREKLIEKNEKDEEDTKNLPKKGIKTDTEILKKDTDLPKTGTDLPKKNADIFKDDTNIVKKGTELPNKDTDRVNASIELPKTDTDLQNEGTDIPKKVADKCKIIKNEHIIRGLQKNLVQNRSMTHLPVTPKETKNDGLMDTEI